MITRTCQDRVIAPSLLAADFSRIAQETSRAISAGADWLHLDVMDGHFVDNISFGPAVIQAIHETNDVFLDVHLMITRPDHFLDRFVEAGSTSLQSTWKLSTMYLRPSNASGKRGCQAGLALNPATPFSDVLPYLKEIDLLLCMTVVPGFGGQSFMAEVMPKIEEAVKYREQHGLNYHIEVDGGLKKETALTAYEAGANVIVAGSSTFQSGDMGAAIREIREA